MPQPAFLFEQFGGGTAKAGRRAAGETLVPFPPTNLSLDGPQNNFPDRYPLIPRVASELVMQALRNIFDLDVGYERRIVRCEHARNANAWKAQIAATLGLKSTLQPRGRSRKQWESTSSRR